MKRALFWVIASIGALALTDVAALRGQTPPRASVRKLAKADVDRMMQELSNWGRWGKDDQLGTVNLITPAKRRAAAALVRDGVSISLARDADKRSAPDNPVPFVHKISPPVLDQFNMDEFDIFFHGPAQTHMDALSHVFHQGRMYNGFQQSEVTATGAKFLGIADYRDGIFARGVLVDIPRLNNLPYLDGSAAIYPEDLDAWEKKTGAHIESGDVVFIRTGRWARRADKGPWDVGVESAGLYASTARWFKQRDIAILGGDGSLDVLPSGIPGVEFPIHKLLIVAMGTPMFDQCDLEDVARAAASRNRWTFLLTAAPLRVPGGTGSPINIIATF
jgi:kynurenine formamidase